MKHILIEYERVIPSVSLTVRVFEKFAEKYSCTLRVIKTIDISVKDLNWCDCIVSIRGSSPLSRKLATKAIRMGKRHILMIDDNLLELPKDYVWMPARRKEHIRLLNTTNLILSSNKTLAERLVSLTKVKRYALVDTIVPESDIRLPKANRDGKIKIVYAAGRDHEELINKYIKPIIPDICKQYGDRISMNFVSVRPDFTQFEDKLEVNYYPSMPFKEYRRFMEEQQFDIGLAPLHNGGFAQYKYFNKFIEYSSMGVLGIYSDCAPYNLIVQDHENGILCDEKPSSWYAAFSEAIENPELRAKCVLNAQSLLRKEFNEEYVLEQMARRIPELLTFDGHGKHKKVTLFYDKLGYRLFRIIERLYLIIRFTKSLGLTGMMKRALEHIKITKRYHMEH